MKSLKHNNLNINVGSKGHFFLTTEKTDETADETTEKADEKTTETKATKTQKQVQAIVNRWINTEYVEQLLTILYDFDEKCTKIENKKS